MVRWLRTDNSLKADKNLDAYLICVIISSADLEESSQVMVALAYIQTDQCLLEQPRHKVFFLRSKISALLKSVLKLL